jgi:hypothetical protein
MKHVTIKVYTYSELSEQAQERAREWFIGDGCWHWGGEWWQSAQEFSDIAPIDILSADYNRAEVDISWSADSETSELSGLRAWKWLQNNGWFALAAQNVKGGCTLTGYCGDCPLFDPLQEYASAPLSVPSLEQVFYECAQAWVTQASGDLDYYQSEEYIAESGFEFTESGEFWG